MSNSSSHRAIICSADKRFVTVDQRERTSCCLVDSSESWDKRDSSFSLRIVSRILQTTDVRLMGLNGLGFVVWGVLRLELPLRGANLQGPWQFGVKGQTVKGFEDLRGMPIRASTLMRVKDV